jgi:D-arabinan exo alpha-(1,3)/(1,5)-arabinofuranosidase (non-reducing end)
MGKFGLFENCATLRDFSSKRASSWDRSGKNDDYTNIPPGKTHTLLKNSGAGCIKHFYWTYIRADQPFGLGNTITRHLMFRVFVLRIFWDGETTPSIEIPLGDFFGISNGFIRPIQSLAFVTNPGADRSTQSSWGFNCYLPMPFEKGVRIEIENQSGLTGSLWYHIDYEVYDQDNNLTEDVGRLHAIWNRENPTRAELIKDGANLTGKDNYIIADIQGDGQFIGYFLTVNNNLPNWYGEGDDMIFIDGEEFPPSIHGTGTEEIFGGGACLDKEYSGPYTGFHCIENKGGYRWFGTNGMYRFYIQDPIRFRTSLKVTLEHGHANDLANDYCTTAFWYQKGVNGNLPPLIGPDEREIEFID